MFSFDEAEYMETRAKLIFDKNKDFSKARITRKDAVEKTYASLLAIPRQAPKCKMILKKWTRLNHRRDF